MGYNAGMKPTRDAIFDDAMRLSEADRLDLIQDLISTLRGDDREAIDAAWAPAAQRRLQQHRAGNPGAIDGQQAFVGGIALTPPA